MWGGTERTLWEDEVNGSRIPYQGKLTSALLWLCLSLSTSLALSLVSFRFVERAYALGSDCKPINRAIPAWWPAGDGTRVGVRQRASTRPRLVVQAIFDTS